MGKPTTLLESLCAHALSFGAAGLRVQRAAGRKVVFALKDGVPIRIADFRASSAAARELDENLCAVRKTPFRAAMGGKVWLIKVWLIEACPINTEASRTDVAEFEVSIDPVPALNPSLPPSFTKKQGQYLAFIYNYTKMHRVAPAEFDLQLHFGVTPPVIHQMILRLELKGFIQRTPGQARSIRLAISPGQLPLPE